MRFSSRDEHRRFLAEQAALPLGFTAGVARTSFVSTETGANAAMNVAVIAADQPTESFAAMFTRNALAGAPVHVGRARLAEARLSAFVINNKVSNVGTLDGPAASEQVCRIAAEALGVEPSSVMPSSTGIIGWRLPVDAMAPAIAKACQNRQAQTILPVAEAIMTTDLYPKARSIRVGDGRIVAIAKGAGMIEPRLATMLAFVLTDVTIEREVLRRALASAVERSFNRLSIDSDTSTSDTVAAMASNRLAPVDEATFTHALTEVCSALAGDVVRNGEGVHHVLRVHVHGAPSETFACELGRAVVNSPLTKTAICGNDANVGRLLQVVGKHVGLSDPTLDLTDLELRVGEHTVFQGGCFRIDPTMEQRLTEYLRGTELYPSRASADGRFRPPVDYPPHDRCVDVAIHLHRGSANAEILGADLSHEYIDENAYYRS